MSIKKNCPTKEEALELLKNYKTPEHVINHCKSVSHVATLIAEELNQKGYNLDLDIITAAGLLHDIARVEENHQDVGAKLMKKLGYDNLADIIKVHMHYTANPEAIIDETSLVCLADKTIMEDKYVGIDTRMGAIIKKFSYIDGVEERMRKKLALNKAFIGKIENIIGKNIDDLVKQSL